MKKQELRKKNEDDAKLFKSRALRSPNDRKRHDHILRDEQQSMWDAHNKLGWSYRKIGGDYDRDPRSVREAIENVEHRRTQLQQRGRPKQVASDPRFMQHVADVLQSLDTYANQLLIPCEPEHFLRSPESETKDDQELEYLYYVKDVISPFESQIDGQVGSETLNVGAPIESEPSFAVLKGHYEGTKIWKCLQAHRQNIGKYLSIGIKIRRLGRKLVEQVRSKETDSVIMWDALSELLTHELAPIRVRLHLEGIEPSQRSVLEKMPTGDPISMKQGVQLLRDHLAEATNKKSTKSVAFMADPIDLIEKLVKTYEEAKRSEARISLLIGKERLERALPVNSKCDYCPEV